MIDGTFDRFAKWWRNAVDRFELQSQEKNLSPKNDFPIFGFWAVTFFCAKKVTNIQIVTHPYLGRLSKNVLEVLHDNIANLARYRKWVFLLGCFWALLPLRPSGRAQKFCQTQKYSTGLLLVRALPSNTPISCFAATSRNGEKCIFPKSCIFDPTPVHPLPVVKGGKIS